MEVWNATFVQRNLWCRWLGGRDTDQILGTVRGSTVSFRMVVGCWLLAARTAKPQAVFFFAGKRGFNLGPEVSSPGPAQPTPDLSPCSRLAHQDLAADTHRSTRLPGSSVAHSSVSFSELPQRLFAGSGCCINSPQHDHKRRGIERPTRQNKTGGAPAVRKWMPTPWTGRTVLLRPPPTDQRARETRCRCR